MNFFDKFLQMVLHEDRLQGENGDPIEENKQITVEEPQTPDSDPQTKITREIPGLEFILNTKSDKIDINKNDIVIVEDSFVDIKDINVEKFVEGHRLSLMSKRINNMLNSKKWHVSKKKNINLCIKFLEDELKTKKDAEYGEEEDEDSANYRDKDKEQKKDMEKIKARAKLQDNKKKLIEKILLILKKKRDLWGIITSERNLNREIGGRAEDPVLTAKMKYMNGLKKKKLMMEEWYNGKNLVGAKQVINKMIVIRKMLMKLGKLLGKKVAVKLLRNLAKKNRLNVKNVTKILKKVIAMKKKMKIQMKRIKNKFKDLKKTKTSKVAELEERKSRDLAKLNENKKVKTLGMTTTMH
jgi:hypothetical protein